LFFFENICTPINIGVGGGGPFAIPPPPIIDLAEAMFRFQNLEPNFA
jgi:hypothetical protein